MGRKRGHDGHGRHGHHNYGHHFGFGMPPMPPMPPMPGMSGPPTAGPDGEPHGPPDPRTDPRIQHFGHHFGHYRHMRPDWCGFGRRGRGRRDSSSSSSSSSSESSSSDSEAKKCRKWRKKGRRHCKKGWKKMRKMMSSPNWNKVNCTLCWRQIRPLAETEVLECGHIYHRLCLRELFGITQTSEQTEIFCTQCHQQIDTDLVTELQNRFNAGPAVVPQSPGTQVTRDMEVLTVN